MWEALGFVALGAGVGLIGRHLRKLYFREFAVDSDPNSVEGMNASLMRRCVAVFLTTSAMMIIVGLYLAASEIWEVLRRG